MDMNLKVLEERDGALCSTQNAYISANSFLEKKIIVNNGNISTIPIQATIYRIAHNYENQSAILEINSEVLVSSVVVPNDLNHNLAHELRMRINQLPHGEYELWSQNNKSKLGNYSIDIWGETTKLLTYFEEQVQVKKPMYDFNKITSKKIDSFNMDDLHLDSFEGMRLDQNGNRIKVWRYFFNLGNKGRPTVFCPLNPVSVDLLIPVEFKDKEIDELEYRSDLLDDLILSAGKSLPYCIIYIPPSDKSRIYGIKMCTTHMLHTEYGPKNDLIAIVNSLH